MINILEETAAVSTGTLSIVIPIVAIVVIGIVAFVVVNESKKRKR